MTKQAVSFEKSNVEDLRRQLNMLLKDADKVLVYKESARSYICGKYNWDDIVEKTLRLYQK